MKKLSITLAVAVSVPLLSAAAAPGAGGIRLGQDPENGPTCYRRESGETHKLDIGINRAGAFIRLTSPEPRESSASNPVRVYAGEERIDQNGMTTNTFKVLAPFEGEVSLSIPDPEAASFLLQSRGDPEKLLNVVAAAKGNFLVLESRNQPGGVESVAVYDFGPGDTAALAACAKESVR